MTLRLEPVFTALLLDAKALEGQWENKPASLFIVPLGKALGGISTLLW